MISRFLSALAAASCLVGGIRAQSAEPRHLVPIPLYRPDSYDQAVFSVLIGDRGAEVWMICQPSFRPEFALLLQSELINPDAKDPYSPTEPRRWILSTVTTVRPIWHFKENPDGSEELDLRANVPVERHRVEIDESLANALRQVWEAVLRQTKYPEDGPSGVDGVTYVFYCRPNYFGQTWSPKQGVPADLVNLSAKLIELVGSPSEKREGLLNESRKMAQKIEDAVTTEAKATGAK